MKEFLFFGLFIIGFTTLGAQQIEVDQATDFAKWNITATPTALFGIDPTVQLGVEYRIRPNLRTELELGYVYDKIWDRVEQTGFRIRNTLKVGAQGQVNLYVMPSYLRIMQNNFDWVVHESRTFEIAEFTDEISGHAGLMAGLGKHFELEGKASFDLSILVGSGLRIDKEFLIGLDGSRTLRTDDSKVTGLFDLAFKFKFAISD